MENTGTTSKAKPQSGPDSIMYISMCLSNNLLLWRESYSSKDDESQIFRYQYIALKHTAVRMKKEKSLDTYNELYIKIFLYLLGSLYVWQIEDEWGDKSGTITYI